MLHHFLKCRLRASLKYLIPKLLILLNLFKFNREEVIKCFYAIVSEECCFHGKDRDITVWYCFGWSAVSFTSFCLRLSTKCMKLPNHKLAQN